VAAALVLSLLSACSTEAGGGEPVASCSMPPSIGSPTGLPEDFPRLEGVDLTEFQLKKKFVATEGFDRRSVEELFEAFRPVLIDEGFDIVNSDFEGFEAELYFAKGNSLAGIVALREAPCDGYVKVNVIYDPLETEAGRKAVKKTRRLSGEG
jgi:hypothetical protein